jgi:hypothetical protein
MRGKRAEVLEEEMGQPRLSLSMPDTAGTIAEAFQAREFQKKT